MQMSILTVEAAVLMVAASVALLAWFHASERVLSVGRMTRMMARFGLDTRLLESKDPDIQNIMKQSRARCARCPGEDRCERWLAGKIGGDAGFCPNTSTFMDQKFKGIDAA